MLWSLVVVPALAGVFIGAARWRASLGWAAASFMTALAIWAGIAVAGGRGTALSWGPRLALTLEPIGPSRVMAVLVPTIAAAVLFWVAATGGGHEPRAARLVGGLVVFVGAMELLVLAADLLTLLVAWELVAVCSWILIGHRYDDRAKNQSAKHAYLTTRVGDVGLFVAAGAALAGTGSLSFAGLARSSPGWLGVMAAGIVVAASAKSAQLPFSPWLFSAMAGPTPVSALLHSATMVAAGAYVLARLAPSFAAVPWFGPEVAAIGLLTSLAAGIVAVASRDLKRALAASTSAQYGLVLVAVGSGATGAAAGHLVTHAAFKALLFLAAGTVATASGTLDLGRIRLRGWSRVFTVTFVVGGAALAALPPLGGAWSKEEILGAAAARSPLLAAGVVISGALSALYAARLVVLVLRPAVDPLPPRASPGEMAPLGVLAGASVLLGGLWLPAGGRVFERLSGGNLGDGAAWELPISLLAIGLAFGAVVLLARRNQLVSGALPRRLRGSAARWFDLDDLARVVVVDPVLALSRGLARADDAVIDAGVRAAAAMASRASRVLASVTEVRVDRVVGAVAGGWVALAALARRGDDGGVDRVVEGVAGGTLALGGRARQAQTGLSHQYYLLVAAGVVAMLVVAVLGRA